MLNPPRQLTSTISFTGYPRKKDSMWEEMIQEEDPTTLTKAIENQMMDLMSVDDPIRSKGSTNPKCLGSHQSCKSGNQTETLVVTKPVGSSTGNPGVFRGYPYPNPSLPVPAVWGTGLSVMGSRVMQYI